MSVVDDYLSSLSGEEREMLTHLYALVREMVPEATEELSYAMPAFKYKGKSLVAILQTKHHLSLYPFCAVSKLGLDLSGYERTPGSIHFSAARPITDNLFRQILTARLHQIDG